MKGEQALDELKWKIDISEGKSRTSVSGQDESGGIYIFYHPPFGYRGWMQRQTGVSLKLIRQRVDLAQIKSTDLRIGLSETTWDAAKPSPQKYL